MSKDILYMCMLFFLSFSLPGAEVLSWSDCLNETFEKNLQLKSSQELLNSAKHKETAAKGAFLPHLKGTLNYSNTDIEKNNKKITEYSSTLTLSQNVFSGFSNVAGLEQARGQRDLADLDLAIKKNSLFAELKKSYANYLYAQNYSLLINEIIKRREANLKMVQMRYEAGRENKGAYLLSKGNLEEAFYEKLQAKNGLSLSKMSLAKILGRDEYQNLEIKGDVPLHDPPSADELNFYLKKTADYKKAVINEQISDAEVHLSKSSFFPQLDLNGTYSKSGPRWFPENRQVSIGAMITFPLFNGGQDYYANLSALDRKRSAYHVRDDVERGELAQISEVHSRYIEAIQKLKVDIIFEEAAQVRAKISREKYNNGLISFEDWDIIETELITRQKALLDSKKNRVTVEANWDQVIVKEVL